MQQEATAGSSSGESWEQHNELLAKLLALARLGDSQAFETFYNRTVRWLLARVRRLVGDGQAEDVLAEVYIQAWTTLATYDFTRAPPTAWLAMMARSRSLDHLRREKSRATHLATEANEEVDYFDGPDHLLSQLQDVYQVRASMALLDGEERLIVGLAYFQDCTYSEISSTTGIPLGSVRAVMVRAQRKLRTHFVGYGSSGGCVGRAASL